MALMRCVISFCAKCRLGAMAVFTDEAIVNRVNADLANDIGNLAQRSLSMIAKNCAGPAAARSFERRG